MSITNYFDVFTPLLDLRTSGMRRLTKQELEDLELEREWDMCDIRDSPLSESFQGVEIPIEHLDDESFETEFKESVEWYRVKYEVPILHKGMTLLEGQTRPFAYLEGVTRFDKTPENIQRLKLFRMDQFIYGLQHSEIRFQLAVYHSQQPGLIWLDRTTIRAIRKNGITYFCSCDLAYCILPHSLSVYREVACTVAKEEYIEIITDVEHKPQWVIFVTFEGLLQLIRPRLPNLPQPESRYKRKKPVQNIIWCNELVQQLSKYI